MIQLLNVLHTRTQDCYDLLFFCDFEMKNTNKIKTQPVKCMCKTHLKYKSLLKGETIPVAMCFELANKSFVHSILLKVNQLEKAGK